MVSMEEARNERHGETTSTDISIKAGQDEPGVETATDTAKSGNESRASTSVPENQNQQATAEPQKTTPQNSGDDEVQYPSGVTVVIIIISLCMAVFLVALDQTIIAPALGAITSEFKSVKDIGWYGAAYLLTTTALQPMYGTIYKLFNIKLIYLGAVFIFEVGSLLCALSPTSTSFIVGRAIAGMGTAGLFSGSIVILSHTLPLPKRPIAFGLIAGMWGIASVAGPLLGGVFTDKATWRWCFYINLPIGGITMAVVIMFLHLNRNNNPNNLTFAERFLQLDLIGTAVFVPTIVCLLLALQWGGAKYPWHSATIIGLFCGFGGLAIIFIAIQLWQGDKGTLPPKLFKNRNVCLAMLFAMFFGAGFFPLMYYLALYFQAIQGDSAVQAGIKILPLLLSLVLMSMIGGAAISTIGYYNPIVLPSVVLFAVGAGMITTYDLDTPLRQWFGYQVICGLGIGAGFQLGILVVQTVLPIEDIPVATACIQFFQSFGGAIFIAVAQTVFQNGLIEGVQRDAPGIDPTIFINSGANQVRAILTQMGREDAIPAVLTAYMSGLRNTYYISVACACAAFFMCAGLSWKSIKTAGQVKDTEKAPTAAPVVSEKLA